MSIPKNCKLIKDAPRDGTWLLLVGDSGMMNVKYRAVVARYVKGYEDFKDAAGCDQVELDRRCFRDTGNDHVTDSGAMPEWFMPLPWENGCFIDNPNTWSLNLAIEIKNKLHPSLLPQDVIALGQFILEAMPLPNQNQAPQQAIDKSSPILSLSTIKQEAEYLISLTGNADVKHGIETLYCRLEDITKQSDA